jgi:hypothetical protein
MHLLCGCGLKKPEEEARRFAFDCSELPLAAVCHSGIVHVQIAARRALAESLRAPNLA